jgi:hypothetical protein
MKQRAAEAHASPPDHLDSQPPQWQAKANGHDVTTAIGKAEAFAVTFKRAGVTKAAKACSAKEQQRQT